LDHLHVGQEMVRQQYRLSTLEVRVTRHGNRSIRLPLRDQDPLELFQMRQELTQLIPHIESNIQRNLIVAASSRVQLAAKRTDQFCQAALNRHMNVFILLGETKAAP